MMRKSKKLVGQYQDRVFTFAHYYLGNREEAEDVTQEVLIRLWKYGSNVENGKLGRWVTKVTRNACFDALRRRKTYRSLVATTDLADQAYSGMLDSEPDPAMQSETTDFHEKVEIALKKIDDPYRSILILREIQDLRYEQISDALELPLNTVKAYLHRGRKMLRNKLKCIWEYEKH